MAPESLAKGGATPLASPQNLEGRAGRHRGHRPACTGL